MVSGLMWAFAAKIYLQQSLMSDSFNADTALCLSSFKKRERQQVYTTVLQEIDLRLHDCQGTVTITTESIVKLAQQHCLI